MSDSDLVTRLREAAEARKLPACVSLAGIPEGSWSGVLEIEAAAEIERLRTLAKDVEGDGNRMTLSTWSTEYVAFRLGVPHDQLITAMRLSLDGQSVEVRLESRPISDNRMMQASDDVIVVSSDGSIVSGQTPVTKGVDLGGHY